MAVEAHAAEAAQHGAPLLSVLILLAAAVIAVPIFRRIGLGSVLGYLAAGLIIGPYGFGFFQDPEAIIHIAELGVVLFLFLIGLEMQPSRLWAMRGEIFGLGFLQVTLACLALTGVGLMMGYPWVQSFTAGAGFVMTSTAIVMQVLTERHEMGLPKGRRVVSILLFEDLSIVPLLAFVAFLAPGGEAVTASERVQTVLIGLAAIAALVIAGRYLLDPMFRLLARFGAREVMTAAALLVVLGAAELMQIGGLSMAMGAFLAGVLLSESTFRHQLEADIEPFRGLLLGLFFLGVGMALNLQVIAENIGTILVAVAGYMILKMAVIYLVARALGTARSEAIERAVLMAQGGEFAFVLYSTATQVGIFDDNANATLTAIIIISMVLTPLMMLVHDRIAPKAKPLLDGVESPQEERANIVLIGFGRVGQVVAQPLLARGHTMTIIESDPQRIRDAAQYGFKVFYGDGSRLDILRAAGAEHASLIISTSDQPEATRHIVELVKAEFPLIPIFARSFDRVHAHELLEAGADFQVRETFGSAIALARQALIVLGETPEEAEEQMKDFRDRDKARFELEIVGGMHNGIDLLYSYIRPGNQPGTDAES